MWTEPTPTQLTAIAQSTSPDRLRRYRQVNQGHNHRAVTLYLLDAALASQLHAHLRLVEVTLREHINRALEAVYGPRWYAPSARDPRTTPAGLGNTCRDMVSEATSALRREYGRSPRAPQHASQMPPGKMVAELMMGFWAKLLEEPSDANHAATLWVPALEAAFNDHRAPRTPRWTQPDAMHICKRLNWARNRVNHCESVVFGFPQKGIKHGRKQLRLPPTLIVDNCRTLVGRFNPALEEWMRNTTDVDDLLSDAAVVAAWAHVENRGDVSTPATTPQHLWKTP